MKKLYALGVVLLLVFSIQTVHADTYPAGCTATTAYSATTGQPCTVPVSNCAPGDLYSAQTGQPCQQYPAGCTSIIGFSSTTGDKCDGSVPAPSDAAIQQQLQAQQHTQEANNAQYLQESGNTGTQNQIANLEQQVTALRTAASSQEEAYESGMIGGQAMAQQIEDKEQAAEAPLDVQIEQLQAEVTPTSNSSIQSEINTLEQQVSQLEASQSTNGQQAMGAAQVEEQTTAEQELSLEQEIQTLQAEL